MFSALHAAWDDANCVSDIYSKTDKAKKTEKNSGVVIMKPGEEATEWRAWGTLTTVVALFLV